MYLDGICDTCESGVIVDNDIDDDGICNIDDDDMDDDVFNKMKELINNADLGENLNEEIENNTEKIN